MIKSALADVMDYTDSVNKRYKEKNFADLTMVKWAFGIVVLFSCKSRISLQILSKTSFKWHSEMPNMTHNMSTNKPVSTTKHEHIVLP